MWNWGAAKESLAAENAARADEMLNFQQVSQLQLEAIQQNETELAQLRGDLSARNRELAELREGQEAQLQQIAILEEDLQAAAARLASSAELEKQLQAARESARQFEGELTQLRPRLERAQSDQARLSQTVADLRVSLANANSETMETQRQANGTIGQLNARVSELDQLLAQVRASAVSFRSAAEWPAKRGTRTRRGANQGCGTGSAVGGESGHDRKTAVGGGDG